MLPLPILRSAFDCSPSIFEEFPSDLFAIIVGCVLVLLLPFTLKSAAFLGFQELTSLEVSVSQKVKASMDLFKQLAMQSDARQSTHDLKLFVLTSRFRFAI